MPLYHLTHDAIRPVDEASFTELGLLERSGLQRLLRSKLDVVAPDCKLIAEEFCSWDDSKRRIDLLAIDKDANLVVIELKRTEDAGHVELQALRYAAIVSTMSFEQAVEAHAAYLQKTGSTEDARRAILDFLEWEESTDGDFARDVRLILVSSDFSKEITSTVLWLNEHDVDIRCVRLRPHRFAGETLVDVQPLIPLPEAAEYQVRVRERNEQRRATASLSSPDRYMKFDITIGGVLEQNVNKRKAILKVVRGLAAANVSPEQIMKAVPERGDRFFVAADGEVDEQTFVAAVRHERLEHGRPFDPARWFCREDELIHLDGRTYAVSNQWGTGTEDVVRRLVSAFPQAGIHVTTDM